MTTLLVDIGNSRIKWARFDGRRLGKQSAAVPSDWGVEDFERQLLRSARPPERLVVASVAAGALNKKLSAAARRAGLPPPEFIASQRRAGGVTVGYLEPWRLGVDRFVAVVGAHHLAQDTAACVIGVGTAMTIDLVTADGRHVGGAIIPAPGLMVDTLLNNTEGIRRRAQGGVRGGGGLFARSTRAAIEQGALYAAAALIDRAVEEAGSVLQGAVPIVILTGGGAAAVKPLVRSNCVRVPDLVLHGLAVLSAHPARRGSTP